VGDELRTELARDSPGDARGGGEGDADKPLARFLITCRIVSKFQFGVLFIEQKARDATGRQLFAEAPAVVRAKGGQKHFRCEACGTISHGEKQPEKCPTCGGRKFFAADIDQPFVESGAG